MGMEVYTEDSQSNGIVQAGMEPLVEMAAGDTSYQDSINMIHRELDNIRQSFLTVGWHLKYIKDRELYSKDGYRNIYEFAADKFQMSQSNVSRYINLCESFSDGHGSPRLDKKYERYDYSQLSEMLPMKQEEREKVTPDMTVRQIREMKKERKAGKKSTEKQPREEPVFPAGDTLERQGAGPAENNMEECNAGTQPGMPALANDRERRKWLADVEAWGMWYEDHNIHARYYKYDFPDGSRLIAVRYRDAGPYGMAAGTGPEDVDGGYGAPYYHMIFSEAYLESHPQSCGDTYGKYFTHKDIKASLLVKFLKEQGECGDGKSPMTAIEFDIGHLGDDEIRELSSWPRKYALFYKKHGYIPKLFNLKNEKEIHNYADTLATSCGGFQGIGSVAIFDLRQNISMLLKDGTIGKAEKRMRFRALIQAAEPGMRHAIEEAYGHIEGWEEFVQEAEPGKIKFYIRKLTPEHCFELMGMPKENVEKCREMGVSDAQLFMQAGNGVVTNCVSLLMEHVYKSLYDNTYICGDERRLLDKGDDLEE